VLYTHTMFLMKTEHKAFKSNVDPSWRIGIVASEYYSEQMDTLIKGALDELQKAGIPKENCSVHRVSGSFEIPLIGSELADSKSIDALIGLGIIVEGETHHASLIAQQVCRGIMDIQCKYRIPFAFEILYVDAIRQAEERLDRGKEAAATVLHSLAKLRSIRS
jgi:6,7-dimethyl-8-ribityllumazine synthase